MKALISTLCILAFLGVTWPALMEPELRRFCKKNSNGCSVPFSSIPCDRHFRHACIRHDNCYGCGAVFGFTQTQCDDAFYDDMVQLCEERKTCRPNVKPQQDEASKETTPAKQRRVLDTLLGLTSLSEQDLRQLHPRARSSCRFWANKYYSGVALLGWWYFETAPNATFCAKYERCMPPRATKDQSRRYTLAN